MEKDQPAARTAKFGISDLLRITVLWLLFVAGFFATCIIFGDIHEAGHARVCIALGGNVGGFSVWLHGVLPFVAKPSTNCSIKPLPAAVWVAGPITSIIAWYASALIVGLLLKCRNPPARALGQHPVGMLVILVPVGAFQ